MTRLRLNILYRISRKISNSFTLRKVFPDLPVILNGRVGGFGKGPGGLKFIFSLNSISIIIKLHHYFICFNLSLGHQGR